MLKSKIDALTETSLNALINKDLTNSLVGARKFAEAFCKVIIFNHYGDEEGKKQLSHKNSLQPWKLVDKVTKFRSGILQHESEQAFVRRLLKILVYHGNNAAHDYDPNHNIEMTNEDVNISQAIIKRLLRWLFIEHLNMKIPDKLDSHIEKYDIFISCQGINEDWTNILANNLRDQGHKVYLKVKDIKEGENYKKRYKNAIESAQYGILIHSTDKNSLKWVKKELDWMEQIKSEYSNFKIIPVSLEQKNIHTTFKNHHVVNFGEYYFTSFENLYESIEGEKVSIDKDDVEIPQDANENRCLGIKKTFCIAIGAFIILTLLVLSSYILQSENNTTIEPEQKPKLNCTNLGILEETCKENK